MLRHAPIRSKVVAILILPLAGLIALAAVGIGTTLARGAEAGRRNDLAQLAVRGNTLVHELQAERTLSSDWVAARPSRAAVPRDGMLAQRVVSTGRDRRSGSSSVGWTPTPTTPGSARPSTGRSGSCEGSGETVRRSTATPPRRPPRRSRPPTARWSRRCLTSTPRSRSVATTRRCSGRCPASWRSPA
jgi:hypothetical protein